MKKSSKLIQSHIFLFLIAISILIFAIYFRFQKEFSEIFEIKNHPLQQVAQPIDQYSKLSIPRLKQKIYPLQSLIIKEELSSSSTQHKTYIAGYLNDGLNLKTLLQVPNQAFQPKPATGYPVLILNHGYISPQSYSTERDYRSLSDFYANHGFIVLKPDYRGHGASEASSSEDIDRLFYTSDVLALKATIPSIENADPNQVFMVGHSMGGEITLRVLAIDNSIKAASLWAPVSVDYPESFLFFARKNWSPEVNDRISTFITQISAEEIKALSTMNFISSINTPILIHHGLMDESVPFEWSVSLTEHLKSLNKPVTFHEYETGNHNFTNYSLWSIVTQRDKEFFEKQL